MFRINIKFAFRHLLKNKSYSLLNIVGLAFGMTCSFMILLWVSNELKYDQFHTKKDNLYQVFMYLKQSDGNARISSSVSAPLATVLMQDVPEIKAVTRIPWTAKSLVKYNDLAFFQQGYYADTSFFEMFSFHLKKGNSKQVLKNPTSIVISEKLAETYFKNQEPIGKTLVLNIGQEYPFVVTGVMENVPVTSSFQFDFVIPFQFQLNTQNFSDSWGELRMDIYIETIPNVSVESINQKIRDIYQKKHSMANAELFIHPFSRKYISSIAYKDQKFDGKITQIIILSAIALIILIIACVNYINLATALASKRSREVGIKKVLGSNRKALILQFLAESAIITLISMLIMIMLVELLLPWFNQLFSRDITLDYSSPLAWGMLLSTWLITSFISGIYPAFAISSFKPIDILKSKLVIPSRRQWQRQALVVFQFTITIALFICMFFFNQQIQYIKSLNLGMDKENIVFFKLYRGIGTHMDAFKNELLSSTSIQSVTYTSMNPLKVQQSTSDPQWDGKKPDDDRWFSIMNTDFDFAKTFNLKFIEGRDFSPSLATDSFNFIINEKAAKAIGFKSAIGQRLEAYGKKGVIIGVVKDFNIGHLSNPIPPVIILIQPTWTSNVFVKIKDAGKTDEAISMCRKTFSLYEPEYPFEYTFQTDFFENTYKNNLILVSKMSSIFSILAIVISCLGLFGLTAFMAEQRTKEIGIRKVNGARAGNILSVLLSDFLKWVALAYVLGILISSYITAKFISSFTYHSELSMWVFINAGLAAFFIAIVTIGWQTYKAASQNPVEALRYE